MSILRTTAIALCALALAGCEPPEPRVFGVPQSQWNSLNHEQQTKVVDGYNAQKKQKAENEPLLAAIGVAGRSISSSEAKAGSRTRSSIPALEMSTARPEKVP